VKAVVWHDVGDIRAEEVPDPKILEPGDAVIRITRSATCGTDLHLVRGTMPGMVPGTVLGHEAVGVVEDVGSAVRGFTPGHRVVVGSTIGCGTCSYCRAGYYAQCDTANPNGPVQIPDTVSDDQAILVSDISPTAWFDRRESGRLKAVLDVG
jgi:threonine dehydrogenase-like Zn-dependent dehydrogenase